MYFGPIRNGAPFTRRGPGPVFLAPADVVILAKEVKVIARISWDLAIKDNVKSDGWAPRGIAHSVILTLKRL